MGTVTFEPIGTFNSYFYNNGNVDLVANTESAALTMTGVIMYPGQIVPAHVVANTKSIEVYKDSDDNNVADASSSTVPSIWLGTEAYPTTLKAGVVYFREATGLKAKSDTTYNNLIVVAVVN